ncbi:PREDICTED: zinc finger protein 84-like [Eurypyga helias]|uniref:zinc finger protein 84-like n=1 Tax=Eurypyga helias TaxID=54383 RepID=UPI0005293366|nr:PREDICTED: zinc finger protein 84-like [Eurypyga helias]
MHGALARLVSISFVHNSLVCFRRADACVARKAPEKGQGVTLAEPKEKRGWRMRFPAARSSPGTTRNAFSFANGRHATADLRQDSVICVKQEEELCAAGQQEEARGAPEEPSPGFQTYTPDVLSWIKEEEEPRCPEQASEREEISPGPSTVHDENTKRDPPADCFESTACDSGLPGRPGGKLSKDPSAGVMWDSQWNSEVMETNTTSNSLGGDTRYERGFGEHLDFCSSQENIFGKRPSHNECERNSARREHLPAPWGAREGETCPGSMGEKSLSEKAFHLPHSQPCAPGEKGGGWGAAPASPPMGLQPTARSERGQNPASATRRRDCDGLGGEQPSVESEENFPTENPLAGSCWDHPRDEPEACSGCHERFMPRGHLARQQQSQGRGKSYICSDCGKSFVCHSWLVRHQMTHTGERPYKCSECDKSYRRKDYLLNHQRRHSGQGLFQCPLCGKRFVLRRSLMKHQESHVQETHLPLAAWPCAEIRGAVMHSI